MRAMREHGPQAVRVEGPAGAVEWRQPARRRQRVDVRIDGLITVAPAP